MRSFDEMTGKAASAAAATLNVASIMREAGGRRVSPLHGDGRGSDGLIRGLLPTFFQVSRRWMSAMQLPPRGGPITKSMGIFWQLYYEVLTATLTHSLTHSDQFTYGRLSPLAALPNLLGK